MEEKNLEQVKELIDRIADSYDLPTDEETEEMQKLTGIDWDAEDLQMMCCEYWPHNSLDETAYLMFHGEYPPVREVELSFWRYKPGFNARCTFGKKGTWGTAGRNNRDNFPFIGEAVGRGIWQISNRRGKEKWQNFNYRKMKR